MKHRPMPGPGVCCVIGAGDATGSAVARRFAKEGYTVCAARRNEAALKPLIDQITQEGWRAIRFGLDARREDQVTSVFDRIESMWAVTFVFPFWRPQRRSISRFGKCARWLVSW